jgi:hypothetical protein
MDLKNPGWMYLKAAMFLLIGACCFVLVLRNDPTIGTAAFLLLMIWAFARAYYFAFYVIEKYIDGEYRFSGLFSFLGYVMAGKAKPKARKSAASLPGTPAGHSEDARVRQEKPG